MICPAAPLAIQAGQNMGTMKFKMPPYQYEFPQTLIVENNVQG
jgi:hypothetical protein